jgi:hypothetical protein
MRRSEQNEERLMKRKLLLVLTAMAVLLGMISTPTFQSTAWADGTETLGVPTLAVQPTGSGIALSGVTPCSCGEATIGVEVPENVTVTQVLLYWYAALQDNTNPNNMITINGEVITGTRIGGPTAFWDQVYFTAFRSDITAYGWVTSGQTSLTADLPFTVEETVEEGVGITVIYSDGVTNERIWLRDGLDLAFYQFANPLDRTTPQIFTFEPVEQAREAHLYMWLGSVESADATVATRPYRVEIDVGTVHTEKIMTACLLCGTLWEPVIITETIPANASELRVQFFSQEQLDPLGASLEWIGASLMMVEPQPDLTMSRDSSFEWRYTVNNPGPLDLEKVTLHAAKGVELRCAPATTTLAVGQSMVCTAQSDSWGKCASMAWVYAEPVGGGIPVVQWLAPEGCIGP